MHLKLNSLYIVLISICSVFISSCEKSTNIGFDLIPKKYVLTPAYQDTFTLHAYTIRVDSIRTSGYSNVMLGTYIDPVFGNVKASFITQLRPEVTFTKSVKFVYDSVVMYLKYDTTYADYNTLNAVNIYEINDTISSDSIYFSNFNPYNLNPVFLNVANYRPIDAYKKRAIAKSDTITNTLALRMNDEYGLRLFDTATWGDKFYISFKGLFLEPANYPYNGTLSIFDLTHEDSKILVHYHDTSDVKNDSLSVKFTLSGYGARFNVFEHQFNAPGFLPDLDNPEVKEDSVVYIQGAAGLNVKIIIPYLNQFVDKNYVVNRAELIINAEVPDLTYEGIYPAPEQIALYLISSEGKLEYLTEFLVSTGYLGAPYENNQYIFDITYAVQQILNKEKSNSGFMLSLADGAYNPARVVLTSGKHSNKMRLKLILTKL